MALLAAAQPWVGVRDYESYAAFERKLDRMSARLAAECERVERAEGEPLVVVFPEHVATFLALAGESRRTLERGSTDVAMALAGARFLPRIAGGALRGGSLGARRALLGALAPKVHALYARAFGRFARAHRAWVVGGSAVLPRGRIDGERMEPDGEEVFNTSYLFDPAGRVALATRKVNLVPTFEDTMGLSAGGEEEVAAAETPAGRLVTLVCYDGFRVPHTSSEPGFRPLGRRVDAVGADVVAQPAANPWPWRKPWTFGARNPAPIRSDQWQSEGVASLLPDLRARYAVTAHLVGRVMDLRFDGRSEILERTDSGVRALAWARADEASAEAEEVVIARVRAPGRGGQ